MAAPGVRLGPDIEFVGEVSSAHRIRLLQDAAALLNPTEWPEPFGLNMIESLAFGTPVLTLAHGAAPEIVTDGHTGFLRAQSDALVGCVDQLHLIDRSECRAEAVRRFSMRRMVLDYLDVYADAMHRDNSGAGAARAGAA